MLCLSNLYYVHAILMYPPTQQLVSHTDWHINIGKYLFWPTYKQTPSVFDSMSKIMIDLTSDSKIRGDKTENPNVLSFPANISTLDQRCFNFVDQRWNNIKTTLHNVETTLIQRCFNLVLTLVKAIFNPIRLVMIGDCEIIECIVNTWIVFILLNEETFFYYILKIQLLMKYQKVF